MDFCSAGFPSLSYRIRLLLQTNLRGHLLKTLCYENLGRTQLRGWPAATPALQAAATLGLFRSRGCATMVTGTSALQTCETLGSGAHVVEFGMLYNYCNQHPDDKETTCIK